MNEEQLEIVKASSNEMRDMAIRALEGGYVVTTSIRYMDKKSGQLVAQFQAEKIAATAADLATVVATFYA